MYRNLMIKGYADLFNVNVLCTDACVWLHTLIYMIKRNPQKMQNPALYEEDHALSNTWRLLKHTLKKNQSKLRFSRYMYTNMLAFQGFFCFEIAWIKNISGMYEATSTFYFTQYAIFGYIYLSVYFTLSRVKELLNAIKWD